MRAEGVCEAVHTLGQPLLGLPMARGQQGFKDFVRLCQEQGL